MEDYIKKMKAMAVMADAGMALAEPETSAVISNILKEMIGTDELTDYQMKIMVSGFLAGYSTKAIKD